MEMETRERRDSRDSEEEDENRVAGPVKDRKCTDVFFLLLFIVFWMGMIAVSIVGFVNGDVRRLYYPSDVYGNVCGIDNTNAPKGWYYDFDSAVKDEADGKTNCNTRDDWTPELTEDMREKCDMRLNLDDYKYLVFINPAEKLSFGGFCASDCPHFQGDGSLWCPDPEDAGYTAKRGRPTMVFDESLSNLNGTGTKYCYYTRYSFWRYTGGDRANSVTQSDPTTLPTTVTGGVYDNQNNFLSSYKITSRDDGAPGVVKSRSLVYRCIPDDGEDSAGAKAVGKAADVWGQMWGDIIRAWRIFLICFFLALVLSLLWILLMRLFAGPMVWLTIILVFLVIMLCGYFCYQSAKATEEDKPSEADDNSTKAQKWFAYLLFFIGFVYFCLIVYLRPRIQLAIGIMEEASDGMRDVPGIIAVPLLMFLFIGSFFVFWIISACYLMSSGRPEVDYERFGGSASDSRHRPTEAEFAFDYGLRYYLLYHFFGLLWTLGWLLAVVFLTIAIAIALWYFAEQRGADEDKADKKTKLFEEYPSPVCASFRKTMRYHAGTLAFGSLIIAIVQMIRVLILFFEEKVEKLGADTPCQPCVKCLLCYCKCCMAYVQRFLEFISKNAYVQCGINGTPFCKSAKRAWKLITANVVRLMTVNFIADFLTFCGKLFVVLTCCIAAFNMTQADWAIQGGDHEELNSPLLIVVLVFIMTWFVAQLFMHIYECTIVCLLQCFLVDEDKHLGQFCSKRLAVYLEMDTEDEKKAKDIERRRRGEARKDDD